VSLYQPPFLKQRSYECSGVIQFLEVTSHKQMIGVTESGGYWVWSGDAPCVVLCRIAPNVTLRHVHYAAIYGRVDVSLCLCDSAGNTQIWQVPEYTLAAHNLPDVERPTALVTAAKHLWIGTENGRIVRCHGRPLTVDQTIAAHPGQSVSHLCYLPTRRCVTSITSDGHLKSWSAVDGSLLFEHALPIAGVTSMVASQDCENLIVSGTSNSSLCVVSLLNGEEIFAYGDIHPGGIMCCATFRLVSDDVTETILLCGGSDRTLSFWSLPSESYDSSSSDVIGSSDKAFSPSPPPSFFPSSPLSLPPSSSLPPPSSLSSSSSAPSSPDAHSSYYFVHPSDPSLPPSPSPSHPPSPLSLSPSPSSPSPQSTSPSTASTPLSSASSAPLKSSNAQASQLPYSNTQINPPRVEASKDGEEAVDVRPKSQRRGTLDFFKKKSSKTRVDKESSPEQTPAVTPAAPSQIVSSVTKTSVVSPSMVGLNESSILRAVSSMDCQRGGLLHILSLPSHSLAVSFSSGSVCVFSPLLSLLSELSVLKPPAYCLLSLPALSALAAITGDGSLFMWNDVTFAPLLARYPLALDGAFVKTASVVSDDPSGTLVCVCDSNGWVVLWNFGALRDDRLSPSVPTTLASLRIDTCILSSTIAISSDPSSPLRSLWVGGHGDIFRLCVDPNRGSLSLQDRIPSHNRQSINTLLHVWDSDEIWSGGDDGSIQVLDLKTDPISVTVVHRGEDKVYILAFTPKGKHIVSSGFDGHLRIWNIAEKYMISLIPSAHRDTVRCCVSDHLLNILWTGGRDNACRGWGLASAISESYFKSIFEVLTLSLSLSLSPCLLCVSACLLFSFFIFRTDIDDDSSRWVRKEGRWISFYICKKVSVSQGVTHWERRFFTFPPPFPIRKTSSAFYL
jgi:WD40 repeat protein